MPRSDSELVQACIAGQAMAWRELVDRYGRLVYSIPRRAGLAAAVEMGPVAPAPGDLNADGVIDLTDLSLLLVDFGQTHSSADFDNSGVVDLLDLSFLLTRFGV